jgi:phenylacetate-CoA ligase
MPLYTDAMERAALPIGDRLLRTEFMSTLRRWRRLQYLPEDELERLQRQALAQLLEFATSTVPHYRQLRDARDDDPMTWLRSFPVLRKRDLVDAADDLVVGPRDSLIASPSSGSSGVQSTVWMTPAESSRSQAYQTLMWEWAGFRLGDPLLQTGMTPERGVVKRVKDVMLRTTYVEAFGITDDAAAAVLASKAARRSRFFGGYASSLYVFARAAARRGIDVRFDAVISWGDKMFPEYRRLIESTFHTRVFDTYGTTEGVAVGAQRDLQQYYVFSPHIVLELLDGQDRPVPVGEVGRVVVTRLDSRAMPLVRYELGDLAVAGVRPPDAELQLPVLERVIGRDTDIVETPAGRHLIVHTFTGIFEFFDEIEQFRIVQREPSGIVVEYLPRPDYSPEVEATLEQRLREVIDEPFDIRFEQVDHIPTSPSGKPQIVVSELRGSGRAG